MPDPSCAVCRSTPVQLVLFWTLCGLAAAQQGLLQTRHLAESSLVGKIADVFDEDSPAGVSQLHTPNCACSQSLLHSAAVSEGLRSHAPTVVVSTCWFGMSTLCCLLADARAPVALGPASEAETDDEKTDTIASFLDKQLEEEFKNEEIASQTKTDLNETLSKEKARLTHV